MPSTTAEECACLDVAAALYEQQLSVTLQARRYLARRGLTAATLRACHVGFATGGTLTHTLEARGVPISAAHRVGLLRGDGRETLSGRIVVPEWHAEHSDWMIGRLLEDEADHPKYLGLPGRKPLLGWGTIASSSHVILTEGVFDWLLLRQWDYPALCLLCTHASVAVLSALRRFGRLYLALDADGAGQEATARLVDLLGHRAVPISLPSGMQDVADLGPRPDGRARFARALEGAERLAAA